MQMQMMLLHTRMCARIHSLHNMRAFLFTGVVTVTCMHTYMLKGWWRTIVLVLVQSHLLDIKRETHER